MQVVGTDKRTLILETALELISANGFHGAPMQDIADRAGIGVGTIYRYFANKEALILGVYEFAWVQITQDVLGEISPRSIGAEDLQLLFVRLVQYYIRNPGVFRYVEQFSSSPFVSEATRKLGNDCFKPLEDSLVSASKRGVLRALRAQVLVAAFYGAVVQLVRAHLFFGHSLHVEDIETTATVLLDSLASASKLERNERSFRSKYRLFESD
jgi:AcrR family transcriptional regulator